MNNLTIQDKTTKSRRRRRPRTPGESQSTIRRRALTPTPRRNTIQRN
jgi:hypothetical protein